MNFKLLPKLDNFPTQYFYSIFGFSFNLFEECEDRGKRFWVHSSFLGVRIRHSPQHSQPPPLPATIAHLYHVIVQSPRLHCCGAFCCTSCSGPPPTTLASSNTAFRHQRSLVATFYVTLDLAVAVDYNTVGPFFGQLCASGLKGPCML